MPASGGKAGSGGATGVGGAGGVLGNGGNSDGAIGSGGETGSGGGRVGGAGGTASVGGRTGVGGSSAPGGSTGSGGRGTGGVTGTGGNDTCEAGTSTTEWASNCPTGSGVTCVSGTFGITNPAGMPAVQYQSEHFAIRYTDGVATQAQAQAAAKSLESTWNALVVTIGFPEPYCDSATKYKVNVHVDPSFYLTGSGTGSRDPAMWVCPTCLGDRKGLAHEFAHSLQFASQGLRDSPYVGWAWESQAEWMAHQVPEFHATDVFCSESLVNFPHVYYGSTRDRYCNWQFWEFVKDKFCYKATNDLWAKAKKPGTAGYDTDDPFSILARNLNYSASQLNDLFGAWAMHNVTWDYRNPDGTDQGGLYRSEYGPYTSREGWRRLRVTMLDELDRSQRQFAVPPYWAPQRWGYNLVRLFPDANVPSVKVTFRGVTQAAAANTTFGAYKDQPASIPAPDSDWRWGLVAVDAANKPRYSALQKGADAEVSFCTSSADVALYLVVVGTPKNIQKIMWDQMYYTVYRYPWMVQFEGAMPEGYQANAPAPGANGQRWANGGGWVANGATVASTAYVGPHAIVLGGTVSGTARIEDRACVENGTVSGNAIVGALTRVTGGIQITDSARVGTVFGGVGDMEDGQVLSGTAQLYGDIELRGAKLALAKGVFYGFVDSAVATDASQGANRTAPPVEVTAAAPYVWRR